ncbi:peptidase S1 and S6, chymotrypsin/Hap [Thermogladius calderae 1633]|uniref:Peptidase S1 and S6, chymotrypsin/Hap n=1 Tax=Thermogladius calderae (strain DSM 22663 / VKM B-2946 / 1633) TaxID=1184251 RepID=I3TF67_THEC1|nr:trypsin-like peptidase domain-containing protein [Thermogladius calderae]AFK51405.1 peptidase S1 and S6, chymotrypsin/Hap [Thermogladius calderae 1633]
MRLEELNEEIAGIVERVKDSVITVATEIKVPLLFFGYESLRGFGSGFIVGKGIAVTNAHVVRNASRVAVTFSDGYSHEAGVIAADASRDLALLEVPDYRPPIELGDSRQIRVGEIVLAVGSPLGLFEHSVTMGVVSATGRNIYTEELMLEDLVQTDAAINPGNSGGPLVNLRGQAVGVTTAIVPYAQGIGFAIPINTVKRFILMIERYGRPVRAWIGVYVAPLNPTVAGFYKLGVKKGLIVARVIPGTPAHHSGLRDGDILLEADGRELARTSDLRETVEEAIDRGYVTLKVLRGGRVFEVDVEVLVS